MKWEQRVRLALVLAAVGCSRHPASCCTHAPPSPGAAASAEVAKILAVELAPEDADATEGEAFIDLVRREAWEEAQKSLEALSEDKKKKPTVRLVTARVAMALDDHATAYRALDGLEKDLSFITDDIEKWRAESAANV